jgi:hypothetical protein
MADKGTVRYFKATNAQETHHGLKYHDGINCDPEPWNPSGSCEKGGIYYADEDHICGFLRNNAYVREVFLLPESRVYPDPEGDKFKTDILELGPSVPMQIWLDGYLERHHGTVGGNLWVDGTAKLEALTSVGGTLLVEGTAKFEAPALTSVGGNLWVYATAKLEALNSVGGSLWVYAAAKLEAPVLTNVGGALWVEGTAKLEALTSVGGNPYSKKGESR